MTKTVDEFLAHFGVKGLRHADSNNTSAVIVALPTRIDPVRLIGEEDKHATLLYFGETNALPDDAKEKIIQTLTLAADMFEPFRESVVDICRLGEDVPPALVGKLTGRWLSKIRQTLQVVPDLNEYLGNAKQYPSYTPHVTFGYPDWEGETELRKLASELGSISFDRLGLWWNDEKYEFPLKYTGEVSVEHAEKLENFLAHFGVKGMKWGVRKTNSISSEQKKISLAYISAQLSDLKKNSSDTKEAAAARAAARVQKEIRNNAISSSKLHAILSKVSLSEDEDLTTAADGARKALHENHELFFPSKKGGDFYRDLMTEYGDNYDSVKHDDLYTDLDNFLAHYGVKGMRWGVRKDDSTGGSSSGVIGRYKARKALKAAEEAKKNAPVGSLGTAKNAAGKTIIVQKQKDGTWKETYFSPDEKAYRKALAKPLHELSTREIQMIADRQRQINEYQRLLSPSQNGQNNKSELQLKIDRLQLEKQYRDLKAQLNPPKKDRIKAFQERAESGFDTYKKINKALDGKLGDAIAKRLGYAPAKSELERLKEQTDLLNARRNNKKAIVDLRKLEAQSYDWLIDDSPSRAVGYPSAGKRRANQSGGKHSEDRLWDIPNMDDLNPGKKK